MAKFKYTSLPEEDSNKCHIGKHRTGAAVLLPASSLPDFRFLSFDLLSSFDLRALLLLLC